MSSCGLPTRQPGRPCQLQFACQTADTAAVIETQALGDNRPAAALKVTHGGTRRVYTRRLRTVHVVLVLVMSTVGVVGFVPEIAPGHPRATVTIGSVVFLVGLSFCAAILRRAIVVTPGLVAVRGLVTTRRIPAAAVARFEPPPPYGKLWRPGLRIMLADGDMLTSGAFCSEPVDSASTGVAECNELNTWLAVQAQASETATGLPARPTGFSWRKALWCCWVTLVCLFGLSCAMVVVTALTDPTFGR